MKTKLLSIGAAALIISGLITYSIPLLMNTPTVSQAEEAEAAEKAIEVIVPDIELPETPQLEYDPQNPPVSTAPEHGGVIGVLHIPSLGADYKKVIAEGTTDDIINRPAVGHFPESQMVGEVGNFALAGHRNLSLSNLKNLKVGDRIYIQTADGYYTYEVKEDQYLVKPTAVEVVAPVPNHPEQTATKRVLTLVTCYPDWGNSERRIIHAEFVDWQPLEAGPPAAIA